MKAFPGSAVPFVLVLLARAVSLSADVTLTVRETAGVARSEEIVHNGIPLAKEDNLTNAGALSIAGVPAQFEVLSRWGGGLNDASKPIQWVLATFSATVAAGAVQTYTLTGGASAGGSLVERNDASSLVVNTGAARFTISKTAFTVLRGATLSGAGASDLVDPSGVGAAVIRLEGRPDMTTLPPEEVLLEHDGPLFVSVKLAGHFSNAPVAGKRFRYVARYSFRVGSPACELDFQYAWPTNLAGQKAEQEDKVKFGYTTSPRALSLLINRVELTVPLALAGAPRGYAGADASTGLERPLAGGQTARLSQDRRAGMSSPPHFSLQVAGTSAAGGFADKPLVAVMGTGGGLGATLQKMKFYEPQALEASAGLMRVQIVAEPQWISPFSGAHAKMVFTLIAPAEDLEAVRTRAAAALDHPLMAWPGQAHVSRTKAFGELWDGTPNAEADKYLRRLQKITGVTLDDAPGGAGFVARGMYGFMTYGLFPREWNSSNREFGSETAQWDGYYFGGTFTDYHNALSNVTRLFAMTGDPELLHTLSFPAARRQLSTQIVQGDPGDDGFFVGWAATGYEGYRTNGGSNHSYFENMFSYYFLTGDRGVLDTLRQGGDILRAYYLAPGNGWMGNHGRVASQRAGLWWFLGHASNDPAFFDLVLTQSRRMVAQDAALLSRGTTEYIFLCNPDTSPDDAGSSMDTEQLWMMPLYTMNTLWQIQSELGDLSMGKDSRGEDVSISRLFKGVHHAAWDFNARTYPGWNGNPDGMWANDLHVRWSGPRVGGTLISADAIPVNSDHQLYLSSKATLPSLFFRASALNGSDPVMRAQAEAMYTHVFSEFDKSSIVRPWEKETALFFTRSHPCVAALANGARGVPLPMTVSRPRRLSVR
jgi:hypothetical protein